jgi:hypothetical protein
MGEEIQPLDISLDDEFHELPASQETIYYSNLF